MESPNPTRGLLEWHWSPPDLSEGQQFFRDHLSTLKQVTRELGGPASWIADGIAALKLHRLNYGANGACKLTILWWEWPREHWTELREGASMNFLKTPPSGLIANTTMSEEELPTAVKFVEELIALGVVGPHDEPIVNNCPLFIVEKAGQAGQWRCIADGKRGLINDCCASDPVLMSHPDDILPFLYPGGFTAIVDASKYFHMFCTKPSERKHLGLTHPLNGDTMCYLRLPMGTRNSPGASGHFGASFVRLLIAESEDFRGQPKANDFTSKWMDDETFDPDIGVGRVDISMDGLPKILVWIHVDDIMIHGPTQEKTSRGLSHLMDVALRVGLICQPAKTKPPAHRQKFCGFIYDTSLKPRREVPDEKIARGLALCHFLRTELAGPLAGLSLSATTGFLQSLVPATGSNIGATYLKRLYFCLHDQMDPFLRGTSQGYHTAVRLDSEALMELDWWTESLGRGLQRQFQVEDENIVVITWGDGSGTGSGGTVEFQGDNCEPTTGVESWMGTWSGPREDTSNWRELRTLVEVLRREPVHSSRYQGKRLFYFTDNMVTYDVVRRGSSRNPALHGLVRDLKRLELQHGCQVWVIHVPGDTMILQGTDGLSRGIWRSALNQDRTFDMRNMFKAYPVSSLLFNWAIGLTGSDRVKQHEWTFYGDASDWSPTKVINRHGFWTVRPSFCRQAMMAAARVWVETPMATSHIFIVPRIMQRSFGRVHKNIQFLGQHDPKTIPGIPTHLCLVPVLLFYLEPYSRSLASPGSKRVDLPATPRMPTWVASQIAHVRGLS
jgi:hypothetical protein